MEKNYILSIDSGTTSCRAMIYNWDGMLVGSAGKEFEQIYPHPGWVEHDPMVIWKTQYSVICKAFEKAGVHPGEIAAIGITNQRETTVVWDKVTGVPVYHAIVWQSRQTSDICEEMKENGLEEYVKDKTGLLIDAYFSASKIKWILDHVEGAREKAEEGQLLFGTIDTWLIWKLTGGVHVTDYSNASRTMLFDIHELHWDKKLLEQLDIPAAMLPEVKASSSIYGYTDQSLFGGVEIPIAGAAGDQQAALFGQCCFGEGMVKCTYGTGCFILMNTGKRIVHSTKGLTTSIAWGLNGTVEYMLEGSIFMGGAIIQWMRDELELIESAAESEYYARQVQDTNGVYLVPAFAGLGAPYWDMYARGIVTGLTRGAGKKHIIRAGLEAIAYQVSDVVSAMEEDACMPIRKLKADGGATANRLLMQFQADIIKIRVERPEHAEVTALGAAFLAGLAVGFWKDKDEILQITRPHANYIPNMEEPIRKQKLKGWQEAVKLICHTEIE